MKRFYFLELATLIFIVPVYITTKTGVESFLGIHRTWFWILLSIYILIVSLYEFYVLKEGIISKQNDILKTKSSELLSVIIFCIATVIYILSNNIINNYYYFTDILASSVLLLKAILFFIIFNKLKKIENSLVED